MLSNINNEQKLLQGVYSYQTNTYTYFVPPKNKYFISKKSELTTKYWFSEYYEIPFRSDVVHTSCLI